MRASGAALYLGLQAIGNKLLDARVLGVGEDVADAGLDERGEVFFGASRLVGAANDFQPPSRLSALRRVAGRAAERGGVASDRRTDLLQRQAVGVGAKGRLDLDPRLLDAEHSEGDHRHDQGGGESHLCDEHERERHQIDQQDLLDQGGINEGQGVRRMRSQPPWLSTMEHKMYSICIA